VLLGESVPSPLQRGAAVPEFSLPALDGRHPVSLAEQRGRVVLVNFWATWCGPCEQEMPAMERLYEQLGGEDFELLAVSVDDSAPEVAAFRDRLALRFPILLDPGAEVARRYQTTGYPESILVDRDGRMVERYVGPREWDAPAYVDRIRRLLSGADAPL